MVPVTLPLSEAKRLISLLQSRRIHDSHTTATDYIVVLFRPRLARASSASCCSAHPCASPYGPTLQVGAKSFQTILWPSAEGRVRVRRSASNARTGVRAGLLRKAGCDAEKHARRLAHTDVRSGDRRATRRAAQQSSASRAPFLSSLSLGEQRKGPVVRGRNPAI